MPSRTLPGLGLAAEWALGENGWKEGMDLNLATLSTFVDLEFISFVADLPGSPTNGSIYIVTSGVNTNKVCVRDQGAWRVFTPKEGALAMHSTEHALYIFRGAAWSVLAEFQWKGSWSNATAYLPNAVVEYGGSLWIAKRNNTNVTPVAGADWALMLPGSTTADGSVTFIKLAPALVRLFTETGPANVDNEIPTVKTVNSMIRRPKKRKIVLVSDIQPDAYPAETGAYDVGGQVAKWLSIRNGILSSHGPGSSDPMDELHIPGDLVDRGLPGESAPQNDYTFAKLFEDLRSLAPRADIYAISGNHDYEYPSVDHSATAKSFTEYLKYVEEQFYYRVLGNVVFIHMGTMLGKTQGAYADFVFDWWKNIVERCSDKIVICETHHPLYNSGLAGSTLDDYYVAASERFTDWMTANPNVVKLWISGHYSAESLGGLLSSGVASQSTAFGCSHVNVGLHIPSYMESGNNRPMSYCVLTLTDGASTLQIDRWNVDTNSKTAVSGKNFSVALPRPVELAQTSSFDGRFARDNFRPQTTPSVTVVELERKLVSGSWTPTDEIQWVQHYIVSDQRRDDVPEGGGPGILFHVPGDTSTNPIEGVHGYGVGGAIAVRRTSASDGSYTAKMELYGAGSGQDVDSLVLGMSLSSAGSAFFGGVAASQTSPVSQSVLQGMSFVDALSIARSGATVVWVNRLGTDGQLIGFQKDGVTQGDITVSGSTVSLTGAHLTRWGQQDGEESGVELLKGTVLSSTGRMCDWLYEVWDSVEVESIDMKPVPNDKGQVLMTEEKKNYVEVRRRLLHKGDLREGDTFEREDGTKVWIERQDNMQLTKAAPSKIPGDRAVAGVLQAIDEDGDFEIAQTGDFVIRVSRDSEVRNGDLVESAGDGTARAQADDFIRSSTVAKIIADEPSEVYPDGSKLYPCLIMVC